MIVVADTSVILNLSFLGQDGLLPLISSVAPLLDRLDREARFWMAPSLRIAILRAAGESI